MKNEFDAKRFIVRERFEYSSDMQCKPGETVLELAARIRQAAAISDFSATEDPLDEALRTHFLCSINNEAVLKALFKVKDNELTFSRAIEITVKTEDAAKVAEETVFSSKLQPVLKVNVQNLSPNRSPKLNAIVLVTPTTWQHTVVLKMLSAISAKLQVTKKRFVARKHSSQKAP